MRLIIIFCFCFIVVSDGFSQTNEGLVFLYKKDGSPAKDIKQSDYFMHAIVQNDTTVVCRYYNTNGPMMRQETFKDSNLTIPNGRFCWYNKKGMLDSSGMVSNGKKDGTWEYPINNT